jgi:hypothetical protein
MTIEPQSVVGIVIAGLGGAAVGLEREWSGHASGPEAHFAGIRTFTLLGALAGVAGWFWIQHLQPAAIVLLGGATALVVAAYVAISRRHIDGTTEVAAFVVLAAGFLTGIGDLVRRYPAMLRFCAVSNEIRLSASTIRVRISSASSWVLGAIRRWSRSFQLKMD